MGTQEYELRRLALDDAGIGAVSALLRSVWPHEPKFQPAYLKWLYVDNPAGRAIGFNAYRGDELVAHYVTVPWDGALAGRPLRGVLSLNTATHPAHQGKGLFTKLAEATYAAAAAEGVAFVIGVANANSTPGFTRKLGFHLLAPLDVRVGVGRCPRDERHSSTFARSWSPALLAWRIAAPGARYTSAVWGGGRSVEAATTYPGMRAVLAAFQDPRLAEVCATLPEAPARARVWMGMNASAYSWPGLYVRVPDRARPSPLNLIFRRLDAQGVVPEREALKFEAVDFDAY
jgi:GNAT superfamily N-acetyltransferase